MCFLDFKIFPFTKILSSGVAFWPRVAVSPFTETLPSSISFSAWRLLIPLLPAIIFCIR